MDENFEQSNAFRDVPPPPEAPEPPRTESSAPRGGNIPPQPDAAPAPSPWAWFWWPPACC